MVLNVLDSTLFWGRFAFMQILLCPGNHYLCSELVVCVPRRFVFAIVSAIFVVLAWAIDLAIRIVIVIAISIAMFTFIERVPSVPMFFGVSASLRAYLYSIECGNGKP